jgi:glycosyltransferase involved in cell wall biosynthesis
VEPKVWVRIGEMEPHDGEIALCDYNDFADHLQYCFKNPDERPNARDYLKEKYSWDNMYKVLDAEFNNGEVRPRDS